MTIGRQSTFRFYVFFNLNKESIPTGEYAFTLQDSNLRPSAWGQRVFFNMATWVRFRATGAERYNNLLFQYFGHILTKLYGKTNFDEPNMISG